MGCFFWAISCEIQGRNLQERHGGVIPIRRDQGQDYDFVRFVEVLALSQARIRLQEHE